MRTAAAFLALALAAAAPCLAQESQQDIAERLVREQEAIRRSALDRVMGAPARAWDHADRDPYHPIDLTDVNPAPPPVPAAAPAPAKSRGGRIPWLLIACLLPIVPLAILGFEKGRRWWREQR